MKTHQGQVRFLLEGIWSKGCQFFLVWRETQDALVWDGRDPHWSEGRLWLVPKVRGAFLRSVCPSYGSIGKTGLNGAVLLVSQPRKLGDQQKGKALSWQAGALILPTSTF